LNSLSLTSQYSHNSDNVSQASIRTDRNSPLLGKQGNTFTLAAQSHLSFSFLTYTHICFASKKLAQLYELDLDDMTYTNSSTKGGLFDGTPDQLQRIGHSGNEEKNDQQQLDESILYFSEEAGKDSGVHGRTSEGDYFTILESPVYSEEVTGMAFSPDGLRLYLAYQTDGKDIQKVG
jgi:hypothetical protein